MGTELATTENNGNLISVIEKVCSMPDANVETLERMLDMQERVLREQAKQEFNLALSQFQGSMPTVEKKGKIEVNGKERSRYAKYEDIMAAAKPLMEDYGFSVTFKTEYPEGFIKISGKLSHRMGHSEETEMLLPHDSSGAKNAVQAIGSSVSYGKRYVLCCLLNIATGDDDDAQGTQEDLYLRVLRMMETAREIFPSLYTIKNALSQDTQEGYQIGLECWGELTDAEKEALWVAPTKGGIFTTKEIQQIKDLRSLANG